MNRLHSLLAADRAKAVCRLLTDARNAWTPAVTITPAWVRAATGCSRGLSSRLASALIAETGKAVQGND